MALSRTSVAVACLTTTVAMVLAGCGRSDGGSAATPAGTLATGAVTGTITMWAEGTEGQDLATAVKGFEKENPGVTVNVTAIPWADALSKYQTAIAAGTTPDLAQMGTTWMANFADAFQEVPSGIDTSGYFSGAKSPAVVNGKAVGVPWYVDTRVIYYRTDLAKKAGYSTPPTTWAGLEAMAKAMQTKAGAKWGITLPAGGTDSFQSMLPIAWSGGVSLMNSAQTSWTLDSPQMVSALKYYQSYFTEGIANPNASTALGAQESAFVSGNTPMLIAAPAEISAIDQAGGGSGYESKYSVMQIPADTGSASTSFVGGSDLAVFKNSAHSAAAWKLVQYLSEPSVQAAWYKTTGDLPAVQSAWSDAALTQDPKFAVFRAQLESVKAPPANTAWTQVSADADQQLERIAQGTDPASALATLQSQAAAVGTGN